MGCYPTEDFGIQVLAENRKSEIKNSHPSFSARAALLIFSKAIVSLTAVHRIEIARLRRSNLFLRRRFFKYGIPKKYHKT
jgi:hypothetical protein